MKVDRNRFEIVNFNQFSADTILHAIADFLVLCPAYIASSLIKDGRSLVSSEIVDEGNNGVKARIWKREHNEELMWISVLKDELTPLSAARLSQILENAAREVGEFVARIAHTSPCEYGTIVDSEGLVKVIFRGNGGRPTSIWIAATDAIYVTGTFGDVQISNE